MGFVLANGRTVMTHVVRADTVTAALSLAYDRRDQLAGAGFGLVGFVGRFIDGVVDNDDLLQPTGLGYGFVVHPDVIATRLGHAMMLLDTLPMIANDLPNDDFVQQVSDAGAPPAQVDQLRRILHGGYGELGQYKFADVTVSFRSRSAPAG